MIFSDFPSWAGLTELVFGDMLFFPPIFKSVLLGFFFWLIIHPLIRKGLYSGKVWHPTLMDLSIYVLCVAGSLFLLPRS